MYDRDDDEDEDEDEDDNTVRHPMCKIMLSNENVPYAPCGLSYANNKMRMFTMKCHNRRFPTIPRLTITVC